MSIFGNRKKKKYRTFLQDSETGADDTREYERGRGVWGKNNLQEESDKEALLVFGESAGGRVSVPGVLYCEFSGSDRMGEE